MYRNRDENNRKRGTLYYPLLFACKGFIQVTKIDNEFDEVHLSHLFKDSAAILDEITYKNGSTIYLEDEDLGKFEVLVHSVNENIEFFDENKLKILKNVYLHNSNGFKEYWDDFCTTKYNEIFINASYFENVCGNQIKNSNFGIKKVINKLSSFNLIHKRVENKDE
ncbi:MAG: hypothetical protein NHB15_03175 [Methanosarcina barkeri]|nr:hypothetical protein [Methanosarcina sp. ERenArc_MAG2]